MLVSVQVFMCVCVCVCRGLCGSVCMGLLHAVICMHVFVCACVCQVCVSVCMYMCTCIYVFVCVSVCLCVCTCVHTVIPHSHTQRDVPGQFYPAPRPTLSPDASMNRGRPREEADVPLQVSSDKIKLLRLTSHPLRAHLFISCEKTFCLRQFPEL